MMQAVSVTARQMEQLFHIDYPPEPVFRFGSYGQSILPLREQSFRRRN
jgi:hypothetical protein